MGGGKSSVNYGQLAAQDQAYNQQNMASQTFANRPDVTTPWGQQQWSSSVGRDPSTGLPVTTWNQTTTLTPEEQAALDSQQKVQMGLSQGAQGLLNQATGAFNTPFDFASLPGMPTQAAQAGNVQQAQQNAFNQMSQMLQPGRTLQQNQLDTKLANMGLPGGSMANAQANQQLQNQWTTEDKQLLGQAMGQGLQDVQAQYGMDTSQVQQQQALRQASLADQMQQRNMPLNELNALLTGQQVQMPQMPGFNPAGVGQPGMGLQAGQLTGAQNAANKTDWGALGGTALMAAAYMY